MKATKIKGFVCEKCFGVIIESNRYASFQSENFSGATTAVPVREKVSKGEETMNALQKAITGGESTTSSLNRVRRKPNNDLSNNKLGTPIIGSGNLSNYETDDQTDQMMDMLVKSATAGEKKTRIRKNRAKDAKSTRNSGKGSSPNFTSKIKRI